MRRLAATLAIAVLGLALASPDLAAMTAMPAAGTAPAKARGTSDDIATPGAQSGSVEAQRAAARAAMVERILQLASWCNEKELFIERDRLWRKVLEIAPDDAVARKGLRYARNVDGTWKEPAPRELKNLGKKWLEEFAKREDAVAAPYGDALLALAQAEGRTVVERDTLIAEIKSLAPNHAGLHAWLGNVQLGDRWVIPETATAKERRTKIRADAKRLMEVGAPFATEKANDAEAAFGIAWKVVLQGENVRIVSSGTEEEAVRIGRATEGAGILLSNVLGAEMRYPGAFTIYILANPGEKEAFLAKLPGLSDDERTRLAALEGTGIPRSTNVVLFGNDPVRRADTAVRHTIGNILSITLAVSHKTAWAWEGIGQYLTRELVGTRLTWFVSEGSDAGSNDLRGKLMTPESNWFQEAYDLLSTGTAVPIEDLLRRDLDHLEVGGTLTGYALVAYLMEGRPDAVLDFVTRAARSEDPAKITGEVLKMTPAQLQERLVQWLLERR